MSLLESLVAFLILTVVSVSVVVISSQSIKDTRAIETHYYAGLVADNELILMGLKRRLLTATVSGKTDMMGRKWYWSIQPSETHQGLLQQWKIQVFTDKDKKYPVITRVTYAAL